MRCIPNWPGTGSTAQELYSRFRHLSAGTAGHQSPRPAKDYDLLSILIKRQTPAVEKSVRQQRPPHSAGSHCYKPVGGVFHNLWQAQLAYRLDDVEGFPSCQGNILRSFQQTTANSNRVNILWDCYKRQIRCLCTNRRTAALTERWQNSAH